MKSKPIAQLQVIVVLENQAILPKLMKITGCLSHTPLLFQKYQGARCPHHIIQLSCFSEYSDQT
ncbi:MAG: hypothetical protein H6749_08580 [Nitrospiraceae bacterium]|nr:hypothetical protein [Nitrospiraceae bacterium]